MTRVVLRAAIVAILLGSILMLVNQTDAILGTEELRFLPMILVYLTPFLVVGVSQLLGMRAAKRASRPSDEFRESFAGTLLSHGILRRALFLGLAAGSINTAVIVAQNILAGIGAAQLPVAFVLQAVALPILFGALSQTLSFRRAVVVQANTAPPDDSLRH